ncbi:MAG: hypothetical protein E7442_08900 [Ruminococcaceae bacterium]|nr:hypothetical protein [Oscillospiraceae bacterium]
MQYFDDILNVYAYLHSQMQKHTGEMASLTRQARQLHEDIDRTTEAVGSLEQETDALLDNAMALAKKMGIDLSDILDEEVAPESPGQATIHAETGKIKFPRDCHFEEGFAALVKEAHEAGFTDVHPEQLLTEEEISRAMAFSQQLDEEFERITGLQVKDLVALFVAVAIRLTLCSLKRFLFSVGEDSSLPDAPASELDASSGVDMGQVLKKNASSLASYTAAKIISDFSPVFSDSLFGGSLSIREETRILREHTPFDVDETAHLSKDQILGYDKYLGWIFGVCNLLTDTVTTKSLKSYTVKRSPDENAKPFLDREVSTLMYIVYPVVHSVLDNKEAVIASVVREATELGIPGPGNASALELYERALAMERKSSVLADQSRQVLRPLWKQVDSLLDDLAMDSLVNTIIAAIHSLMYRSDDGDLSYYTMRTNKIILYSGLLATVASSIPALLEMDVAKINFGGLINSLLSLFHSTSFWINLKADFLVNTYKSKLAPYMEQLDEAFELC